MLRMKNTLRISLLFICLFSFFAFLQKSETVSTNNPDSHFEGVSLEETLVEPMSFAPVPPAKDQYWKNAIPKNIREDYIKLGKQYKGKDWKPIPDSLFADFKKTGNRTNFETPYFEKRRQLSCLVMAEIMDYQGVFLKDIDKGLNYFISEVWWGLPASYPTNYPDRNNQKIELFNPETGNLLAWTIYMLHDELEAVDKGICDRVSSEIQRRILLPARVDENYWCGSLDNWNTWISSNLISCILFCEPNREEQIGDLKRVIGCLDYFITNYHNDGGCEEGIMYWDRAGASLFESVFLLDLATNHALSLQNDKKLKAIGSYAYKMYIGNRASVNFADSHPFFGGIHINILYPFGKFINDSVMMKQAVYIAKDHGYDKSPASAFRGSGNFPTLSRELLFLSQYDSFVNTEASEPLLRDAVFDDLHVIIARSKENSKEGLFVAAKGGNNNEYHNHNDIGNFVVYKDAEPIIVDIGVDTYTSKTFSDKRYELYNCRSGYHNVPIINGFEQCNGRQYQGCDYNYQNKKRQAKYSMDVSQAYPAGACIEEWKRTISLKRGKEIVVTEKYKLGEYIQPSEITLICCGEAKVSRPGIIIIDNGKNKGELSFNPKEMTPTIERVVNEGKNVSYNDNTAYYRSGKRDLYRIRLTINSKRLKGKIKYTIR